MLAATYSRTALVDSQDLEKQQQAVREYAAEKGFKIVASYTDAGKSSNGASRPGMQALLEAAASGKFEAVITKDLARFSRSIEGRVGICEELQSHGVKIFATEDGLIPRLHLPRS